MLAPKADFQERDISEITHTIPAEQAEYLRQKLAAMAFWAMQEGKSQKLQSILKCIDMLAPGAKPDWPICTSCGKAIEFKAEYVTYSSDDDTYDFCVACDPDYGAPRPRYIAHNPEHADRDIDAARKWIDELIQGERHD